MYFTSNITKFLVAMLLVLNVNATEVSQELIEKNAHEIDLLVAQNFRKNKFSVPDETDDATFVRRALLVAAGRIPTAEETIQFLERENPD